MLKDTVVVVRQKVEQDNAKKERTTTTINRDRKPSEKKPWFIVRENEAYGLEECSFILADLL